MSECKIMNEIEKLTSNYLQEIESRFKRNSKILHKVVSHFSESLKSRTSIYSLFEGKIGVYWKYFDNKIRVDLNVSNEGLIYWRAWKLDDDYRIVSTGNWNPDESADIPKDLHLLINEKPLPESNINE